MRQIRKRFLKQSLALLLILCMLIGTVPVSFAMDFDDELPAVSEEIAEESAEAVESLALEEDSALEDKAEPSKECEAVDEAAIPAVELPEETAEIPTADSDEQAEDGFTMQEAELDEAGTITVSSNETAEPETGDEQHPADEEETERMPLRAASAPIEYHNENSEYAIVLGPDGVTSGYAGLDETVHSIGNYTVPKTYVLRFQDESFTISNSTGARIDKTQLITISGDCSAEIGFAVNVTRTSSQIMQLFKASFLDDSLLTAAGYEPDEDASAWYYLYLPANVEQELKYALLIEITPNGALSETGTARLALGEMIGRVTGENADNWYQSGDRFNGKTTSENGFWSDMQTVLAEAQGVYENAAATAVEMSTAASNLSAAIDALIPATCVNATELYEAIDKYSRYEEVYYTEATWAPFAAAMTEAQELLTSLFNDDGSCTDVNVVSNQAMVDEAVQAMDVAFAGLLSTSAENSFNYFALLYRRSAEWLLAHTALVEDEYTAESWAAWVQARNAMAACVADGCGTTEKIRAYLKALSNANTAYYSLESRVESVTVHVRVADTFSLLYPAYGLTDAGTVTYDDEVTLTADKTVGGLMDAIGFDKTQMAQSALVAPVCYVYINGEMAVDRSQTSVSGWNGKTNGAPQLHDGDEVLIAVVDPPAYYYYVSRIPSATYDRYYTYLSILHIEDSDRVIEAEAGKPFEISVTKTTASAEEEKLTAAAGGIDIFLSEPKETADLAKNSPATTKIDVQTDENGNAVVTWYTEGWYRLAVADVTPQTTGGINGEGYVTGGAYENLAVGDYVLLYVLPSADTAAVRKALQDELDTLYGTYDEEFYTAEQWSQISSIYTEATEIIGGSDLLGDAYAAQKDAVSQIQTLIDRVIAEHQRQISNIEWFLNRLPDQADDFTEYYQERFENLKDTMDSLSPYMLGQLTLGQREKYDMLLQKYDSCEGNLPAGRKYVVTFDIDGECENLYACLSSSFYSAPWQAIQPDKYLTESLEIDPVEVIPGSTFGLNIFDSSVTDQYDWPDIQVTNITVNGVNEWIYNISEGFEPSYTEGEYRYSRHSINYIMPDNDVTIHITVGSVASSDAEDLEAVKNEAILHITDLFDTYDEEKYTEYDANIWNSIVTAKDNGLAAVAAAKNADEVAAAVEDAVSWMLSIGRDTSYASSAGIELPEMGDPVGRVRISLENTTYTEGNTAFESHYPFESENVFFSDWYDLCENDTMMTAALKAFAMNGLSWLGTGGDGYDITYLSTVYVDVNANGNLDADEPKLAEFDGGTESGWMGTLNDWFVNLGMDQFTYSKGKIHSGDIISIKYTSTGLGNDLGGTFGETDTSLKALVIDGGTLEPAFDGSVNVYTLIVPDGKGYVRVTPTAANKNYLVKTFLNAYDTDDAWYSTTRMIPVKTGDVLYVGCGEYSWPSMNKQSAEAVHYSGTKYTFYVVGAVTEGIDKEIELLPAVKDFTYRNYKDYSEKIIELYASYSALSEAERERVTYGDKIESLHEKVIAFTHIDEVKALIAALPKQSEWTDADKPSLQAVLEAYDTLSEAEKLAYMTVSEGSAIAAIEEYLTPVATVLYGDANGDGVIDPSDATRIMRYYVGYSVTIDLEAADANGDGVIDPSDATRVMRYYVGYDVTLGKRG